LIAVADSLVAYMSHRPVQVTKARRCFYLGIYLRLSGRLWFGRYYYYYYYYYCHYHYYCKDWVAHI